MQLRLADSEARRHSDSFRGAGSVCVACRACDPATQYEASPCAPAADRVCLATVPCAPGSFSATGRSPCGPCPASTYAAGAGAKACVACPDHAVGPAGSASAGACACTAGYGGAGSGAALQCQPVRLIAAGAAAVNASRSGAAATFAVMLGALAPAAALSVTIGDNANGSVLVAPARLEWAAGAWAAQTVTVTVQSWEQVRAGCARTAALTCARAEERMPR